MIYNTYIINMWLCYCVCFQHLPLLSAANQTILINLIIIVIHSFPTYKSSITHSQSHIVMLFRVMTVVLSNSNIQIHIFHSQHIKSVHWFRLALHEQHFGYPLIETRLYTHWLAIFIVSEIVSCFSVLLYNHLLLHTLRFCFRSSLFLFLIFVVSFVFWYYFFLFCFIVFVLIYVFLSLIDFELSFFFVCVAFSYFVFFSLCKSVLFLSVCYVYAIYMYIYTCNWNSETNFM